jgi:oxepin-CoA hydrolase/3-oxo-5,6-dehydrosuberyl-CoA semialdehyde dehydrogenase
MKTLKLLNYAFDRWAPGEGSLAEIPSAIDGRPVAMTGSGGLDFGGMLRHAREVGGPALRQLTFHERARIIKGLGLAIMARKEELYELSYQTGATRKDGWIDIEGGAGTLFSFSSKGRRELPDAHVLLDGAVEPLSKSGTFIGQHIYTPLQGAAVHINAFNFPVWGMLEKLAPTFLAGMPAIVKPASSTAYLCEAAVRVMVDSGLLPPGSLQLIVGGVGDLFDHLSGQDVVSFTGSASTALKLRSHPAVQRESVKFVAEQDSLNASLLGPDAAPGTPEFDLFVKEVVNEMTVKAGQKCTAIRRIFVPENLMEPAWQAIGQSLDQTPVGNPENEKVRMGALAGKSQREEVRSQVSKLMASSQLIYGSLDSIALVDADFQKGAFMSPLLLLNENPFSSSEPHTVEAFGPVSTLMPYRNMDEAIELARKGKGSLCCSIVTASPALAREFVLGAASHHGRILVLNNECAKESTGHGSPLPMLVHGGPGRAGGGEEMGGIRGVKHYMQRLAVQGSPTMLTAITNTYHPNARQTGDHQHPFRKHFEDLQVGETLVTQKRTITETDIVNFANISWDHFYAHVDHTSLEGTIFQKPVAHGYFILSAAAGLFVDGNKGPVLLNYGIEECRFIKPVYAGSTIGVRLTVKEKTAQEKREDDDVLKGIVKWYVDVYDETGESVALATILTLVKRRGEG